MERYTRNELRVLWYLKRHNGVITAEECKGSTILNTLVAHLEIPKKTLPTVLRNLETRCLILRTYARGNQGFGTHGYNPLLKVELIDRNLDIPPLPHNPPAVIIVQENEELLERTATEPTTDQMVMALVDRIVELQGQLDKLQQIIVDQEVQVEQLKKQVRMPTPRNPGLTQAVRNVLTPDQWEKMRHTNG